MRAKEFITSSQSNLVLERAFSHRKSSTMVTMYNYPTMPSADPYQIYRFGMAMADHTMEHPIGPTDRNAVIVAYTKGDEEIIKNAERQTKHKGKLVADKQSREPKQTHTTSPVAKSKKNKYGV